MNARAAGRSPALNGAFNRKLGASIVCAHAVDLESGHGIVSAPDDYSHASASGSLSGAIRDHLRRALGIVPGEVNSVAAAVASADDLKMLESP